MKFCVLSLTEAVRECFVLKRKSGEETPMVQESTVQKASADWLRYAAARVKKTVSVTNYNCLKFTIFLAFLLQSVYLNGLVAALLLCGGLLSDKIPYSILEIALNLLFGKLTIKIQLVS